MRLKPRRDAGYVVVLIASAAALYVVLSACLPLWMDEAFSLGTTSSGPVTTIRRAILHGLQPPFYFLLLFFWRQINHTFFFARLFSVFAVVGVLSLVPAFSRRYLPGTRPLLLLVVLSLNPFSVYAATEIRLYGLGMLLGMLLLVLFYDAFVSPAGESSLTRQLLYAVVAAAALYTQYFFAFLLFAQFVAALIVRRRVRWRPYLTALFAVTLLALPLIWIVRIHVSNYTSSVANTVTLIDSGKYVLGSLVELVVAAYAAANWIFGERIAASVLRVLRYGAAVAFLVAVLRYRRHLSWREWHLLVVVVGLAGSFVLASVFTGLELMQVRHLVAAFLPFVTLPFALLSRIGPIRRRAFLVLTVALSAVYTLSLIGTYRDMSKPGDVAAVMQYTNENRSTGEVVLVFPPALYEAVQFYGNLDDSLTPLPAHINYDVINTAYQQEPTPYDPEAIGRVLEIVASSNAPFWLITGVRHEERLLNEEAFNIIGLLSFIGYTSQTVKTFSHRGAPTTLVRYMVPQS